MPRLKRLYPQERMYWYYPNHPLNHCLGRIQARKVYSSKKATRSNEKLFAPMRTVNSAGCTLRSHHGGFKYHTGQHPEKPGLISELILFLSRNIRLRTS